MTIEKLAEALKKRLPDYITDEKYAGVKIHYKDSDDIKDPIKAPWIYLQDMAFTIEPDGIFKVLDFHDEEHPLYFATVEKLLDYFAGVYETIGLITKEEHTKEYAEGVLKTVQDAVKYEFADN